MGGRGLRRSAPASVLALALGCGRERPVEAPVVDIAVGEADAGARAAAALADPEAERPPAGDSIVGRWIGIGRQDDGQSWPLQVEITTTASGVCATAEYPTIPCRAEWLCTGEAGGVVEAQERLLDDSAQRCVDNGTMTIRLRGRLLEWSWSGAGQTAEAKLHRAP